MKHYEHIVIGFGKGGKTLAGALASKGHSVALIERSQDMFGGTCINVACIPSKFLETNARLSNSIGGDFAQKAARYAATIASKRALTSTLRGKNYAKAASAGVEVIVGAAEFIDAHSVNVTLPTGEISALSGDYIYINTGARPFVPPIPGLKESKFAFVSESMMELDALPEQLAIIGGGYIGLEFASYYANFGSRVTIIQDTAEFMPREDAEIAASVKASLIKRGITIIDNARVQSVTDGDHAATLSVSAQGGDIELTAQAILVATGRRPNIEGLHPERAGVKLTERGAIAVDEHLATSAPNIYAMGDVTGGLQFTYMSLDDSRIVKSAVLGDGSRTTLNRGAVPYSVFLDPPMARVGLTEQQAAQQGYTVKVARLPAAAIPKAQVLGQPTGLLKAVINADTGEILGAHFFCAEAHELINTIKLAMDVKLPYAALRDAIYTHPTMSEAFNDLFASV